MAMLNEVIRTPEWLRVEITPDPRSFSVMLNIGVKCMDGWAHLVSLEVDDAMGYLQRGEYTKLRTYQLHHEFATKKLASETLENT